jgi:hypothetical protein
MMIEFENEKVEQLVPKRTICNRTAKVIEMNDHNWQEMNLIHNFSATFGYGSRFDDETWEFDLTEDALVEIIKTFKIRPTGFAEGSRYPDKVFEEWVKTGNYNWRSGWTEEELIEERLKRKAALKISKEALEMLNRMQNK